MVEIIFRSTNGGKTFAGPMQISVSFGQVKEYCRTQSVPVLKSILSNRGGQHWDRCFMEAFLRSGCDRNNWTKRNVHRPRGGANRTYRDVGLLHGELSG